MKKRNLFIHVGPPKTGSSALQHVMKKNKGVGNVCYPPVGLWQDGSHHNLVFSFFGFKERPEITSDDLTIILKAIQSIARESDKDLLISSESLVNFDASGFANHLLAYLGENDFQLRILYVTREHFARASSMYNQAVKDNVSLERDFPDDYLAKRVDGLSYRPQITRIMESVKGQVEVINYHPSESFVPRFLEHIGLDSSTVGDVELRNVSLSKRALIATLAANRASKSPAERVELFDQLRKMPKFFSSSGQIFSREIISQVTPSVIEDREYLLNRWGISISPGSTVSSKTDFTLSSLDLQAIFVACPSLKSTSRSFLESFVLNL